MVRHIAYPAMPYFPLGLMDYIYIEHWLCEKNSPSISVCKKLWLVGKIPSHGALCTLHLDLPIVNFVAVLRHYQEYFTYMYDGCQHDDPGNLQCLLE